MSVLERSDSSGGRRSLGGGTSASDFPNASASGSSLPAAATESSSLLPLCNQFGQLLLKLPGPALWDLLLAVQSPLVSESVHSLVSLFTVLAQQKHLMRLAVIDLARILELRKPLEYGSQWQSRAVSQLVMVELYSRDCLMHIREDMATVFADARSSLRKMRFSMQDMSSFLENNSLVVFNAARSLLIMLFKAVKAVPFQLIISLELGVVQIMKVVSQTTEQRVLAHLVFRYMFFPIMFAPNMYGLVGSCSSHEVLSWQVLATIVCNVGCQTPFAEGTPWSQFNTLVKEFEAETASFVERFRVDLSAEMVRQANAASMEPQTPRRLGAAGSAVAAATSLTSGGAASGGAGDGGSQTQAVRVVDALHSKVGASINLLHVLMSVKSPLSKFVTDQRTCEQLELLTVRFRPLSVTQARSALHASMKGLLDETRAKLLPLRRGVIGKHVQPTRAFLREQLIYYRSANMELRQEITTLRMQVNAETRVIKALESKMASDDADALQVDLLSTEIQEMKSALSEMIAQLGDVADVLVPKGGSGGGGAGNKRAVIKASVRNDSAPGVGTPGSSGAPS